MSVWHTELSESQKRAVFRMAAEAVAGTYQYPATELQRDSDLSDDELNRLLILLERENHIGLQEALSGPPAIMPRRSIIEVAHGINHPPAKDYWDGVVRWFRTRWWSVPLVFAFVVVPLLVQWIEMLEVVLGWLAGRFG